VHLSDGVFMEYIDHVLASLRAMNITACSVTVDSATSARSLELFKRHRDIVINFVGIHPEAADREDLEKFREMFQEHAEEIDGIGEIGLDRTYEERGVAAFDSQKRVFEAMLELADSTGKPVSIHSRKALDDIFAILPSYELNGVLLHWFAGSKKQLERAAGMNLYVSFGPALVYSEDKKALLRNAPRDKILVETDGPVVYSHCFEKLPASPSSFLVSVVSSLASVLGLGYDEAAAQLEGNFNSYVSAIREG
jgi:TatD DNase family protein